jgi:hypothetical protein
MFPRSYAEFCSLSSIRVYCPGLQVQDCPLQRGENENPVYAADLVLSP